MKSKTLTLSRDVARRAKAAERRLLDAVENGEPLQLLDAIECQDLYSRQSTITWDDIRARF